MPVKDSIETVREALAHLYASADRAWTLTVYNDFSSAENTLTLTALAEQYGFCLVNWAERTTHPSPNYLLTLRDAQQSALADGADLIIVESDVMVTPETAAHLRTSVREGVGMVAAVTHDAEGHVNFPYLYAADWPTEPTVTTKRLSFCCTLLTLELLQAFPFDELNPKKDWFDVTISRESVKRGFTNILLMDAPVLHKPHSSRPWKQLKYTHPLKYYLLKLFCRRDKI